MPQICLEDGFISTPHISKHSDKLESQHLKELEEKKKLKKKKWRFYES